MTDSSKTPAGAGSLAALRALSHPVRLRIWSAMGGGPASAATLSRTLGLEHASASYHLRHLRDAGLVVLAEERTVNGGVERRYRQVDTPTEPTNTDAVTADDWVALVAALGALLQARASQVTADPKWFVDAELWLDPTEATRIRRQLDHAFEQAREVSVDPTTPGACRVSLSALLFQMDPEVEGEG